MKRNETVRPSLEYDRGPVLWAFFVTLIGGLVVNFVLFRPGWLMPIALLAGGVAAARSGFYQPSANSGAIGTLLGVFALTPVLAVTRVIGQFGAGDTTEVVFMTLVLVAGWFPLVLTMMILGYVGAALVDLFRRRVGGPVGY